MPEDSKAKTPQEIKRQKLREQLRTLTGIEGPEDDRMLAWMASIVDFQLRLGLRTINPDEEDSSIHCNSEWHFARYSGPGSTLVASLYGISFHLACKSGNFNLSGENIARFLNKKKADEVYAAAALLVADGFWQVIEQPEGMPVNYKPIGHAEWAAAHPNRCTKKIEIDWVQDDPELAKLGKNLFAILGGEKFHRNILLGVRNAAVGLSDEEISAHGKKFLQLDKGKGKGQQRRVRFIEYLRNLKSEEPF